MKRLVAAVGLLIVITAAILFTKPFSQLTTSVEQTNTPSQDLQPKQDVDFTASFEIVTNRIKRNFNAKMYHNISPDVYIEGPDPSIIHVKKSSLTWDDFFKTLPMELTKECLTTGTGEKYCDGENGNLRFFLNGLENPNLLDKQIAAGDHVLIQFSK